MKKIILLASLAIGIAASAFAGLQVEMLAASTNNIVGGAANTYAIPGDVTGLYTNGLVKAPAPNLTFNAVQSKDIDIMSGGVFANPGATNVTVAFVYYSSVDSFWWNTNVLTDLTNTIAVPASTTATNFSVATHVVGAFSYWALRSITVTPAFSNITGTNLVSKAQTKTGL